MLLTLLFAQFTRKPSPPRARPLDLEALAGPWAWQRLDPEVQQRFAVHHPACIYRGTLTTERNAAGALFAWLGTWFGRPLPSRAGRDIPAEVHVQPDGKGGMVWERWLLEPGRPAERVRSTKQADTKGRLIETTDRLLGMQLEVSVEGAGLVFQSRGYFLARRPGGRRLHLPTLLTPGRCRVTHQPVASGKFHFTLAMDHPLWGRTLTQHGLFQDEEPAA